VFIPRLQILNSANVSLAMTFGRVVTGPDLGNVGELLRGSGNPIFDPRNPADAARAIHDALVLAHKGELGESNRKVAMTDWSADRCASLYVDFFVALMETPRR
jgi:glycosyltransferase involved in cell wall biosynthesis